MGDKRQSPEDVTTTPLTEEEVLAMQAAFAVDVGAASLVGTREYQQDAYFHNSPVPWDGGVLAFGIVCDGMGGMENGGQAAENTVGFMSARLSCIAPDDDVPNLLLRAAWDANERLLSTLGAGAPGSCGTTLVAAVIAGGMLHWVSVGDSRMYILRGSEMIRITRDHNLSLQLSERAARGEITPEEAGGHPHGEALLSFIGIPLLEVWDVNANPFVLAPGDIILLCTDGVTKALSDEDIQLLLTDCALDMRAAAERIAQTAVHSGTSAKDNTTVLLMRYRGFGDEPMGV